MQKFLPDFFLQQNTHTFFSIIIFNKEFFIIYKCKQSQKKKDSDIHRHKSGFKSA